MQENRLAPSGVMITGDEQEIYQDGNSVGILVLADDHGLRRWVWRPDHQRGANFVLKNGTNLLMSHRGHVGIARVSCREISLDLRGGATLTGPPAKEPERLFDKVEESKPVAPPKAKPAAVEPTPGKRPRVFDLQARARARRAAMEADAYQNRKVWWKPWTWF